jgi:putative tricarboxylic transport membrane protein
MKDLGAGITLLIILGAYYVASTTIQISFLSDDFGPTGLPDIYTSILLIISLLLIGTGIIKINRAKGVKLSSKIDWLRQFKKPLLLLFSGFAYIFLLNPIGYLLASFLLLTTSLFLLSNLNINKIILIASVGSLSYWLIFSQIFNAQLPVGWIY